MPQELESVADFKNVITHFSKKLDSEQRTFYLKLFDMTKKEPDFVLESVKNGVKTREYIKIYQHTQSKDLYYLAFTQQNDNIKITGIPTTQLNKVIKDIARSDKILKAEDLGEILQTAKPIKSNPSPQLVNESISQIENKIKQLDKEEGGSLYTSPHNHAGEILPETSSKAIPNPTLKNAESLNIQSFLGINYGNINKQASDKLTSIEKQTNKNLVSASGIDDTALNSLIIS